MISTKANLFKGVEEREKLVRWWCLKGRIVLGDMIKDSYQCVSHTKERKNLFKIGV